MSDPFLGEIEVFAFGFAPKNWLACNGQVLPINQFQALFALLGTTFGGNGTTTFALPNLQGKVANGQGSGAGLPPYVMGQQSGEASHTLLISETPQHTHSLNVAPSAATATNTNTPGPTVVLANATFTATPPGNPAPFPIYAPQTGNTLVAMSGAAIGTNNGGQPHANMMPYLTMNVCIAMAGIFPSRN